MLKALFSSNTRVKLLTTFLTHPEEEFFIRELTRKLDEQINSIRRELDNLKRIGLLKSKARNRKKYFILNTHFPIYAELRSIFLKAGSHDEELIHRIGELGQIELLLLNGFFIGKEASVDLLIVGDVDKAALQKVLAENAKRGDVKFTIITKKDFLYRLECKDKFVYTLVTDPESVLAINKLKKELEKIRPT